MKRVSLQSYEPLPPLHEQYSVKYMERNQVLKLGTSPGGIPLVGVCAPVGEGLIEEIEEFHRSSVEFVEIAQGEFTVYLGRALSRSAEYEGGGGPNRNIKIDKLTDDAPIINLVNSLFIEAIQKKASDIHIEGRKDRVSIRYRIDGVLEPIMDYDPSYFSPISSRIKIMADLNIMERRLPQDGRISVSIAQVELDMRLSIVPIAGGESIVLRIFNRRGSILSLEDLGFSGTVHTRIEHLYRQPHGLVLFTGPTGSGKTTSLNAIIRKLDNRINKIVTIEDPVEYQIEGVNQIQTNEGIGLTFHSLLRRVLRQDPNIIMVGEIRDAETAQLAIRAALTGHLVLSSLHTNDAISSVQRLINMGVESYLLAAVLRGAVAQRLVRLLCPHCRKSDAPSPGERRIYETNGLESERIFRSKGCSRCSHTGYSGRTTISECFVTSSELEALIVENAPNHLLWERLKQDDVHSLLRDGLEKIVTGITSLKELERVL